MKEANSKKSFNKNSYSKIFILSPIVTENEFKSMEQEDNAHSRLEAIFDN